MKYVILKVDAARTGFERVYPIVFPEYMTHISVAEEMQRAIARSPLPEETVVHGAGFCRIGATGLWECYGGSDSLRIPYDVNCARDTELMNMPEALQGLLL